MAGAFGMLEKTERIGQRLFDRALHPSINETAQQAVIIANGFSCQKQIVDNTGRDVMHPVEVLEACL